MRFPMAPGYNAGETLSGKEGLPPLFGAALKGEWPTGLVILKFEWLRKSGDKSSFLTERFHRGNRIKEVIYETFENKRCD